MFDYIRNDNYKNYTVTSGENMFCSRLHGQESQWWYGRLLWNQITLVCTSLV